MRELYSIFSRNQTDIQVEDRICIDYFVLEESYGFATSIFISVGRRGTAICSKLMQRKLE